MTINVVIERNDLTLMGHDEPSTLYLTKEGRWTKLIENAQRFWSLDEANRLIKEKFKNGPQFKASEYSPSPDTP